MVGEGVLHECLEHPAVERVLALGRKSCGVSHPKLLETVHSDFSNLSGVEPELTGYNACFFCSGVSSIGLSEEEYRKATYDLTINAATTLARLNPDMTFCYVSGAGTDGTEQGRSMWARVKGKTENALLRLPFKSAYAFRPGYMQPTKGLKNALRFYAYTAWMYPLLRALFPGSVSTLKEVGAAMINAALAGYERPVLEVRDIVALARKDFL